MRTGKFSVGVACHQATDLCCRKTNSTTAPISNFVYLFLQIFEGKDRLCEIIESFQHLSYFKAIVLQSELGE